MSFEEKAEKYYSDFIVDKSIMNKKIVASLSVPKYVKEQIVAKFLKDEDWNEEVSKKIRDFTEKYLPPKDSKNIIKDKLFNGKKVKILDDYKMETNLKKGKREIQIPFLSQVDVYISEEVIENNKESLIRGRWGLGSLSYDKDNKQVCLEKFESLLDKNISLEKFKEHRKKFGIRQWIDLIISTIGLEPCRYNQKEKILLITRILPIVQKRVNLIELAPKATGKSFFYRNISRYVRVVSEGKVTPAAMFYNRNTGKEGLISKFDSVVLDEIQSVKEDSKGELITLLKNYLESGEFSRGEFENTSDAGFVMLGNIALDKNRKPIYRKDESLLEEMPEFLQETAFIDRIHGFLPGWNLPKIEGEEVLSSCVGFRIHFFAQILKKLRRQGEYDDYVDNKVKLKEYGDIRDQTAIKNLSAAYLKILFPNLNVSSDKFIKYCLQPAIELRQRIKNELCNMDPEYQEVNIQLDRGQINPEYQKTNLKQEANTQTDNEQVTPKEYVEHNRLWNLNARLYDKLLESREQTEFMLHSEDIDLSINLFKVRDKPEIRRYTDEYRRPKNLLSLSAHKTEKISATPGLNEILKEIGEDIGLNTDTNILKRYLNTYTLIEDRLNLFMNEIADYINNLNSTPNKWKKITQNKLNYMGVDQDIHIDNTEEGLYYNEKKDKAEYLHGGIKVEINYRENHSCFIRYLLSKSITDNL